MAYDPGLADRVRSILERRPGFSERNMFGGVCFMINGHMCCGIVKTDLMLRLAEDAVASALRQPHTRPMDFTGKPMKSMVYIDAQGCDSDEELQAWVEAAHAYALSQPAKPVKTSSSRAPAKKTASRKLRG